MRKNPSFTLPHVEGVLCMVCPGIFLGQSPGHPGYKKKKKKKKDFIEVLKVILNSKLVW